MRSPLLSAAVLFLVVGLAALAHAEEAIGEKVVTGYVTDSHCKGDGAKAGHRECALKCAREKGGKLGVWDTASSKFYPLADQKQAEEFAGFVVTVRGMVGDAGILKASSIVKAPAGS